ncbi:NAD-dependent epimerase/dehydratase family protein [Arthrobacter sp. NPDC058130]|uniref:NAD-dependent epimerase/dehydratase family protein n=1 Tax=Arthrobacter sp. NPDC058130 TaxID=3346353 RepID=UPI0036E6A224
MSPTHHDISPLKVLILGGSGTISSAVLGEAVHQGMDVTAVTRTPRDGKANQSKVTWLQADIRSYELEAALIGHRYDAVINFLSFDASDAARMVELFTNRTEQYVHISSASVYGKPLLTSPVTESTQRHNRFTKYARDKIAAEDRLLDAFVSNGFPITVVRPSHTYDDRKPPVPGGWTVVHRMLRGEDIPVHGDGTSLWTLTHAADLAVGIVGLLGEPRAVGEAVHITSDDIWTWDQIYTAVGQAFGSSARLVHVPSEMFPLAAPEWEWSELLVGDLSHSAVFDNTKIRKLVPEYRPAHTFSRALRRMAEQFRDHPDKCAADSAVDDILDRMAHGYCESRSLFASLRPEASTQRGPQ